MTETRHDAARFDGLTVQEHAQRIAGSVRALNHLTHEPTSEALRYPSDIYRTVMALAEASEHLPQTFRQLDDRLAALAVAGQVLRLDPEPDGMSPLHTLGAAGHAAALANTLGRAGEYLSRLAYNQPENRW